VRTFLIIVGCLVGLGLAVILVVPTLLPQDRAPVAAPGVPWKSNNRVGAGVALHGVHWETPRFMGEARASFTIVNDTDFPIKDVAVTCDFHKDGGPDSGTAVSHLSIVIDRTVEPRGRTKVSDYYLGTATRGSLPGGCSVKDYEFR
jgi:hypothetical protein